jgi:DNA-3-methyladenine glycosylase
MLTPDFFDRDALIVARELIGKVLYSRYESQWLSVQIIETEAYLLNEKASHSSLGFTKKREALFMPSGTIYMYHAHGEPLVQTYSNLSKHA